MENQNAIDQLNALIQINNDRIEGYETAAEETKESDLIQMFNEFKQTSVKCRAELSAEVSKLGGEPTDSTKLTGKFFRVWMDVKAALTNKDRHAILDSCEYGEDHVIDAYEDVLDNHADELRPSQLSMVRTQFEEIKAGHDTVKSMRDAVAQ